MRHLSIAEIYAASNATPEGHAAEHLEKCGKCASAVAGLRDLQYAFAALPVVDFPKLGCPTQLELADYVEGTTADAPVIKAHLEKCDHCFTSTAHYFAESSRMKEAAQNEPRLFETPEKFRRAALAVVPRPLFGLREFFERYIVAPMPALATALVMFVALLATPPARRILVVKDSPNFSIYQKQSNALPYFYFGGDGKKIDSISAGMRVTAQRGRVIFDWTPAKGAKSTYFFLQEIVNGAPSKLKEIKNAAPPLVLDAEDFKPGAVYKWVTAGSMGDDKYFDGRMEFKISEE